MVLKKVLFHGAMAFAGFTACGQSQSIQIQDKLYGEIRDSVTNNPIGDVHITVDHSTVVSNAKGEFNLTITDGDSISFSHVSYEPLTIVYKKTFTQSPIKIHLVQDVTLLREVTISPFYTEDEFKAKLLTTEPKISKEQEIANENSERIKSIVKFAPPSPTLNEQFYVQMKGPQGIMLFSNDPSKGIIKAFKNIFSPEVYTIPKVSTRSNYRYRPLTFINSFNSNDSTVTGKPLGEALPPVVTTDSTTVPTDKKRVNDKL